MAGKTYFLVDLENVGLDGIQGSGGLRSDDEVHIFSTSNGPKMDIATLAKLNNFKPSFHDIPPKKQSVDEFPPHARDFSHELGGLFFAFPRKV